MAGRSKGRPRTDLVAIVDLGSAAVRFIIARIRPSVRYDILVEERVPTRLGGGAPGTLPARAIERTRRAVHRFFRRYAPRGRGPRVVAIATSAVRDAIRERLRPTLPAAERDEHLVGLGGTMRTLASVHLRATPGERKHRNGLVLHQSDVTTIRARLEALSARRRRKIRGLKEERADIILAGAMVVEEVMIFGGYLRLVICTRGVRDGLLLQEAAKRRT